MTLDKKALTKPFPSELVKKRPYDNLEYVAAGHYVTRLNRAYDHNWSLEVLEHWVSEVKTKKGKSTYVMVKIRLTAGNITKESFGGHMCATHELADAYKSAVTDGMKKAAWMLGVGVSNWLTDEMTVDFKLRRADLINRTKAILDNRDLSSEEKTREKEEFLAEKFGTSSSKYIFEKYDLDELEILISKIEKEGL